MTTKIWDGATASIASAHHWRPAGAPVAGDLAIIATGAALADHMTLDGYSIRLAGNGIGVAPTLELNGTALGAHARVTAQASAPGGTSPTAAINANGVDSNAGQIVAGKPGAPATLQILMGSRLAELDNTGLILAEPGSTIAITAGQVVNNGRMVADGGAFALNTQLTGVGTVLIEHGGAVTARQIVGNGQTFLMHGGALALASADNFLASLQGWDSGSALELLHTHLTSADVTGGTLNLHDGEFLEAQIRLVGHYDTADFHIANQADGTALVTTSHVGPWS